MHETAVDKLELHQSNATTPVSRGQQHISISPKFTWAVQKVFTIEKHFQKVVTILKKFHLHCVTSILRAYCFERTSQMLRFVVREDWFTSHHYS